MANAKYKAHEFDERIDRISDAELPIYEPKLFCRLESKADITKFRTEKVDFKNSLLVERCCNYHEEYGYTKIRSDMLENATLGMYALGRLTGTICGKDNIDGSKRDRMFNIRTFDIDGNFYEKFLVDGFPVSVHSYEYLYKTTCTSSAKISNQAIVGLHALMKVYKFQTLGDTMIHALRVYTTCHEINKELGVSPFYCLNKKDEHLVDKSHRYIDSNIWPHILPEIDERMRDLLKHNAINNKKPIPVKNKPKAVLMDVGHKFRA